MTADTHGRCSARTGANKSLIIQVWTRCRERTSIERSQGHREKTHHCRKKWGSIGRPTFDHAKVGAGQGTAVLPTNAAATKVFKCFFHVRILLKTTSDTGDKTRPRHITASSTHHVCRVCHRGGSGNPELGQNCLTISVSAERKPSSVNFGQTQTPPPRSGFVLAVESSFRQLGWRNQPVGQQNVVLALRRAAKLAILADRRPWFSASKRRKAPCPGGIPKAAQVCGGDSGF